MGIAVYEQAPDAATLLIAGGGTDHRHRGRSRRSGRSRAVHRGLRVRPHHRPGAHVHARDGHGRAADARGRDRDRQAHRRRPAGDDAGDQRRRRRRSPRSWPMADKIAAGEMQISEAVDGFVSDDEADDYVAEEDFDEFDEEDDDDGNGGSKALTQEARGAEDRGAGEVRRACAASSTSMRKAYEKEGYKSPAYNKAQHAHQRRADDDPLHRQDDREAVRHPAQPGRRRAPLRARDPQASWSTSAACRRSTSSSTFPPNVLNLKWAEKEVAAGKPYSDDAGAQPAGRCRSCSSKLIDLQAQRRGAAAKT